jgi:hypothetical protein
MFKIPYAGTPLIYMNKAKILRWASNMVAMYWAQLAYITMIEKDSGEYLEQYFCKVKWWCTI